MNARSERITRRTLLSQMALGTGAALLAACTPAVPQAAPTAQPTAAATGATAQPAGSAAPTAKPSGLTAADGPRRGGVLRAGNYRAVNGLNAYGPVTPNEMLRNALYKPLTSYAVNLIP